MKTPFLDSPACWRQHLVSAKFPLPWLRLNALPPHTAMLCHLPHPACQHPAFTQAQGISIERAHLNGNKALYLKDQSSHHHCSSSSCQEMGWGFLSGTVQTPEGRNVVYCVFVLFLQSWSVPHMRNNLENRKGWLSNTAVLSSAGPTHCLLLWACQQHCFGMNSGNSLLRFVS